MRRAWPRSSIRSSWADADSMHPAYLKTRFKTPDPVSLWPRQFAIVTAYATTGKEWPSERNTEADQRLESELMQLGCWHRRVTGFAPSTGHAEPGWAAELGLDEARELGHRFLQHAVFHVRGDELSVAKCAPAEEPTFVGSFRQRVEDAKGLVAGICPEPMRWLELFENLKRAARKIGIEEDPPKALILGGWNLSYDWEKALRWHETLAWAHAHGLEEEIALEDADFHQGGGDAEFFADFEGTP